MAAVISETDREHLAWAIEIARQGEGRVEPNPQVGCVLTSGGLVVGEGWHREFGGPHAEVEALTKAGKAARGGTAYVSLEPCCHAGKTPPCTQALVAAGIARVVVGTTDPNPKVSGGGIAELRAAAVQVDVADGELAADAADLVAPFAKLVTRGRPWIIAKWAMTLDGKLAAADGSSQWISGEESREVVHQIRGRVDAILVGRGTAERDDPLLTARPGGPRRATRIVVDSQASLSPESRLVKSASDAPVLVAASGDAPEENCRRLRAAGVEVWQSGARERPDRLAELLGELGRREFTNVLVEGGAEILGALLELGEIDEVHAFVAPKLVGGDGRGAIAGRGVADIAAALCLQRVQIMTLDDDVYVTGRVQRGGGQKAVGRVQ